MNVQIKRSRIVGERISLEIPPVEADRYLELARNVGVASATLSSTLVLEHAGAGSERPVADRAPISVGPVGSSALVHLMTDVASHPDMFRPAEQVIADQFTRQIHAARQAA